MEAECASYWRSVDAICEESEMIAHLQSLLWSSSDVDLVPSSNVSYSLPGGSPFCINNNENSALVSSSNPHEDVDTLALTHGEKVGSKRKAETYGEEPWRGRARCSLGKLRPASYLIQCHDLATAAIVMGKRINARLRILQDLIPNGKKVDISTMLDETVQYVKFLHMQIKLLSSDELWMYAPLAYDSVNMGMRLNSSSVQE
ncbi:transcription factor bHLH54-like [Panicum miliaceum]|uniref:Transcription factor bHLH54-like n=1 Tax=Panicum miliaceum TaxID=4540 RepID=A0A3L6R8F1_PANMI|nr:transcription factor bHLH54-like [Panicum miliaceum]